VETARRIEPEAGRAVTTGGTVPVRVRGIGWAAIGRAAVRGTRVGIVGRTTVRPDAAQVPANRARLRGVGMVRPAGPGPGKRAAAEAAIPTARTSEEPADRSIAVTAAVRPGNTGAARTTDTPRQLEDQASEATVPGGPTEANRVGPVIGARAIEAGTPGVRTGIADSRMVAPRTAAGRRRATWPPR